MWLEVQQMPLSRTLASVVTPVLLLMILVLLVIWVRGSYG